MKKTALLLFFALATTAPQVHAQGGVPLWTNRYDDPAHSSDVPGAVAVDRNGNVFVTGYSFVGGGFHYATVAYSGAGVPLWTNFYFGGYADDEAIAIATDGDGNVIVTGQSWAALGGYAFATVAYSGAGVPLWTNRFYPGQSQGFPSAVATDKNGNVFVTGHVDNYDGSGSYFATLAYSSTGATLWTGAYHGPPGSGAAATALALDTNGNVAVTGISDGGGFNNDYATVKYSNAGVPLWTNRYSGPTNGQDKAYAVAVDNAGNVFVTGYSVGTNGHNEYATLAYSDAGSPLWTNRYRGPGGDDKAAAIGVDSTGNVFVTGASFGTNGYYEMATVAYSGAGLPLWTNRFAGTTGKSLAVDRDGNLFVAGGGVNIVAYSGAGALMWTNRNEELSANALAVDKDGNLFVTGRSPGSNFIDDYATVKYSPTVRPYLSRERINNGIVLSWPNSLYRLQSAPAVNGPFTNLPGATSPYTNSLIGVQQFFRLISN